MRRYATLGKTIAEARRARGLRQVDLAEEVGMSRVFLSHCEQGRKRPSGTTAKILGEVLGIDLREAWEKTPMKNHQRWE